MLMFVETGLNTTQTFDHQFAKLAFARLGRNVDGDGPCEHVLDGEPPPCQGSPL